MFLTHGGLVIIIFLLVVPEHSVGTVNDITGIIIRVEKSPNSRDRNETESIGIQNEGIHKVERDIIISVLIIACVTPIICGIIMLVCQLFTQVKRKHINRRLHINQKQVIECDDTLDIIRKMGPLQLHESFPQYINGITREEMECYMNLSAIERELGGYMNISAMRNNPKTGQIEGHEARIPVTPPHVTMLPRIAVQYPSPVISTANVNYHHSPLEELNYNLYPPLPFNFKNGTPMFPVLPKNSTPRSPIRATPPKILPSIRETPGRSRHDRSVTLLKQMTLSPPPSYNLVNKKKDAIGKSLPCLLSSCRTSSNTNLSVSGAADMKERSASESDISV